MLMVWRGGSVFWAASRARGPRRSLVFFGLYSFLFLSLLYIVCLFKGEGMGRVVLFCVSVFRWVVVA